MSETRTIGGVEIPFVGNDDRMHRAIMRQLTDLQSLKKSIADTGVATAAQNRQVELLEESISSLNEKQRASTAAFGSAQSQLGKMRDRISATAGAAAGFSSTMGAAGGSVGKFASVATQAFGAFAVGGPIALGFVAVAAGIAHMTSKMEEAKAKAEASRAAFAESILGNQQTLIGNLEQAKLALDNLGKSATQASLAAAQAQLESKKASLAMGAGHLQMLIGQDTPQGWTESPAAFRKRKAQNDERIAQQKLLNDADKKSIGVLKELVPTLEKLDKGERLLAESKKKRTEETKEATRATKEDLNALRAYEREILGVKQISIGDLARMSAGQNITTSMIGSHGSPIGPSTGTGIGTSIAASQQSSMMANAMRLGAKEGLSAMGLDVGKTIGSSMMPVLGQISGVIGGLQTSIIDGIKQGFQIAGDAASRLLTMAGLPQVGAAAKTGTDVAGAVAGAAFAPRPTLLGPVGGAISSAGMVAAAPAIGGLAAFASVLGSATAETKSYARFQAAMGQSFQTFRKAMEPVFENMMPIAGLTSVYAQALARLIPAQQASADIAPHLFSAYKSVGITALTAADAFTTLNATVHRAIVGFYDFLETLVPGAQYMENAVAAQEALSTALAMDSGVEEARAALTALTMEEMGEFGNWLADLSDGAESFNDRLAGATDAADTLSSSMRNIPDFFNAARARRDVSDGNAPSSGNGFSGSMDVGNVGTFRGGSGASVNANVYVERMEVEARDAQNFMQQMRYAQYASGGRPLGGSGNQSYNNRGDF